MQEATKVPTTGVSTAHRRHAQNGYVLLTQSDDEHAEMLKLHVHVFKLSNTFPMNSCYLVRLPHHNVAAIIVQLLRHNISNYVLYCPEFKRSQYFEFRGSCLDLACR